MKQQNLGIIKGGESKIEVLREVIEKKSGQLCPKRKSFKKFNKRGNYSKGLIKHVIAVFFCQSKTHKNLSLHDQNKVIHY